MRPVAVRVQVDELALSQGKERDVRKVVVTNNVTLDGVMQAPARADEDRRGGFDRGGWAAGYDDPVMAG